MKGEIPLSKPSLRSDQGKPWSDLRGPVGALPKPPLAAQNPFLARLVVVAA